MKKTIAALALIAPLTFVAACGSGDSADETTSVAPTTVTSEIASEETTTEEEPTSEEETTEPEETTEEPTPEPEAEEAPSAEDPLAQGNYVEPEQVQGGTAANDADRAEIEGLVHGIYGMDTFHQFLRYIPEHTCNEVVAAQGGAESMDLAGIPDQPLAEWDYYVSAQPHIASVTDVQVEGDRASAVVTAVSAGQSETRTQRYLREDGRWKFCN